MNLFSEVRTIIKNEVEKEKINEGFEEEVEYSTLMTRLITKQAKFHLKTQKHIYEMLNSSCLKKRKSKILLYSKEK
jgi:PleD family two-component response regulator